MGSPDGNSSLKDLEARLRAARGKVDAEHAEPARRDMSGVGVGLRIAVDLVAGVAVGVGIGWFLDDWLDTKPWFLLVFTIVGFCAGLLNVMRTAKQIELRQKAAAEAEQAEMADAAPRKPEKGPRQGG